MRKRELYQLDDIGPNSKQEHCYDNPVSTVKDEEEIPDGRCSVGDLEANVAYGLTPSHQERRGNKYLPSLKTFKPFRRSKNKDELPLNKAGLFSYIMYSWLTPLMSKCNNNAESVDVEDLWKNSSEECAANNIKRLEKLWDDELRKKGSKKPSFVPVWFRFVRTRLFVMWAVFILLLGFRFTYSVIVLRELLEYLEAEEKDIGWGITLAVFMTLGEVGRMLSFASMWAIIYQGAGRFRSASIVMVYKKLLKVRGLKKTSVGELLNITVNDSQRIFEATTFLIGFLNCPISMTFSLIYGYYLIGVWSLVGNATILMFYPIQVIISKITHYVKKKCIAISDARVRRMAEVISSIKLIKMYAWEKPFTEIIKGHRDNERVQLERLNYTQSLSTTISPIVPTLAAVVTIVGHTLSGNSLNAAQAFTLISNFNIARIGILVLPWTVRQCSEALVGLRRLVELLTMEECAPMEENNSRVESGCVVRFQAANLAWDVAPDEGDLNEEGLKNKVLRKEELVKKSSVSEAKAKTRVFNNNTTTLRNIDLSVKKGQLVGIVGAVGSGKTSLLSAVIGLMRRVTGEVEVNGKIVYAAQLPWIFNGTVRENILFGGDYDEERYSIVVHACSLDQDFAQLADGDNTEIGDRGVNLSGGQKQRISLARAVYSDRDVYLLDDPLSAVDVHVGRHIFFKCIKTILAGKTVLLATHQLQYLKECDHVVMLRSGEIIEQGTHESLLSAAGDYADLMSVWDSEDRSTADDVSTGLGKNESTVSMNGKEKSGKLTTAEGKQTGDIPFREYKMFFKAAGGLCALFSLVFVYTLYVGSGLFCNWWLSYWINQGDGSVFDSNYNISSTNLSHFEDRLRRDVNMNNLQLGVNKFSDISLGNITNSSPLSTDYMSTHHELSPITADTAKTNSISLAYSTAPGLSVSPSHHVNGSQTSSQATQELTTVTVVTSSRATDYSNYAPQSTQEHPQTEHTTLDSETATSQARQETTSMIKNSATSSDPTEASGHTTQATKESTVIPENTTRTRTALDTSRLTSQYTTRTENTETKASSSYVTDGHTTSQSPETSTGAQGTGNIADNPDLHFYVTVYGVAIGAMILFGVIKCSIFTKMMLRASTVLHNRLFQKVAASPMSFFDTTPPGRILNRFSKDLDETDVQLPFISDAFAQQGLIVFGSFVIMCVALPWFLIAAVPLSVIFWKLKDRFKVGIRQLKRLDNISRSPVLGFITSSVNGLSTIRAFNRENQMIERFTEIVDQNSVAFNLYYYGTRWVSLRLDVLSFCIGMSVAFTVVLVDHFDTLAPSVAGLVLMYGIELSGFFQLTMRLKVETEARFTSVERIQEYIQKLSPEGERCIENNRPDQTWPKGGAIEFVDYSMRYRNNLPLVLKQINCGIKGHEKIGIVGRTGSGKSSLAVALFRLAEPAHGRIELDGTDVSKIGLEDLRSKLSIIPQDPVLFVGTMRYNLDPFNQHDDEAIWSALENAHIKDKVFSLPLRLESPVEENGQNFSVGERQLLCMTRALLRRSKILLLDEATAAIDTETDAKIQTTIRESFKDCTLLTIAHRLNTVLDSDKIMVMDNGQLVEFGTPTDLLRDPSSRFNAMMSAVEKTEVSQL